MTEETNQTIQIFITGGFILIALLGLGLLVKGCNDRTFELRKLCLERGDSTNDCNQVHERRGQ